MVAECKKISAEGYAGNRPLQQTVCLGEYLAAPGYTQRSDKAPFSAMVLELNRRAATIRAAGNAIAHQRCQRLI